MLVFGLSVIVARPAGSFSLTRYDDALKLNVDTSSSLIVSSAGTFGPSCGAAPPLRLTGFDRTRPTLSADSASESFAIWIWKLFDISPGSNVRVCAGLIAV